MDDLAELRRHLAEHDQAHVAEHWASLDESERRQVVAQVTELDLALLRRLYGKQDVAVDWAALAARAEPPAAFRLPPAENPWNVQQALSAGRAALDAGQVGVVLVAGGQGTRLGFDQPKGMYPIGSVSSATLYRILAEGVLAAARRHRCEIPLYVMTSPATHDETVEDFKTHNYFGLPAGGVKFFCQGMLPALDAATGRLLLAARDSLALGPDGHGGLVGAFHKHGCLDDAEQRGLRYLYYVQVDNPLVRICDPEFLGYHILSGSEMSTQVIAKRTPTEKVGNVVAIDGRTQIIEYSDLPADQVERTTPDGRPVFWAGNIAVHVLDTSFLRTVADSPDGLPFHQARKKVAHYSSGEFVAPTEPNAIKFERFIFDLLPAAREAIVMEVDRAANFAPVKNADGEPFDTPTTVRKQMSQLHSGWLQACGVEIVPETPVEISPLAATTVTELQERVATGEIRLPKTIERPYYLTLAGSAE